MSFSEWREVRLKEVIDFNPRESLSKGKIAKKIPMENIEPFKKKVIGFEEVNYKGGTKFRNGDTLFARITPSLENGKTAKVDILDDNEIGFGSTEFIVFRAKVDVTTDDYIYYLAVSDYIRDIAIKSMTGTSGRQRAQTDVIEDITINLPPLQEQKSIAHILSTLDEKIEVNNRINKTLEEMAQAIFKHWFVDFEFPNEDGEPYMSSGGEMVDSELGVIPKGWEVMKIEELCEITSSKRIFANEYSEQGIPFYRGKEIIEKSKGKSISTELFITNEKYSEISEKYQVPKEGDMLLTSVGTLGTPYLVVDEEFYFKDGNLTWFRDYSKKGYREYVFLWIQSKKGKEVIDSITIGSTQKALTISVLKSIKLVMCDDSLLEKFHNITKSLIDRIQSNNKENAKLSSIRDTLLPKLMSGEIRVPLDIEEQ